MKINRKKSLLLFASIVLVSVRTIAQETFVNRMFQDEFATPVFNPILNPLGLQWSQTIQGASGSIITVAHTAVAGQGENILLTKRNADGGLIFQTNYNSGATKNDYGTNVFEAGNGDIYVCGTTDNGGTTNYNAIILKYSSSGTLLNSATYAGSAGLNDIATALKIHPNTGRLIVVLTNENSATGYDYQVLQMNTSNLSVISSNTYDGYGLTDIALGLEIASPGGNISVIGGSQSTAISSAYALAVFNQSLGFISATRTDLVGSPSDQPLAYVRDSQNNTYITGKTFVGNNYNIRTVKINSNYTIAWNVTMDVNGLDDIGSSIVLAPNGNVVIGGLCTKPNNKTDMISVTYNNLTGVTIGTSFIQSAENPSGSAAIKKVCAGTSGAIYFLGTEKGNSGKTQVVVGKIGSSTRVGWQKKIANPSQDILPSDLNVTTDGVYAISVKDSVLQKFMMTGFNELILDTAKKYMGGQPVWKKGELLVVFAPDAVNKAAVDNLVGTAERQFGKLSDFLTPSANAAVNNAVERICKSCNIQAIKVYGMKTTDTTAVTRQGETISIPAFWSTFLLKLPATLTENQLRSAFKTIPSIVHLTQLNNYIQLTAPPNDSLYANASNLHTVGANTNAHINVEEAWNIATGCGSSTIKGGIYDTGIMFRHKDFGYNGTGFYADTSGSYKLQGWYFAQNFGNSTNSGGVDMRTPNYVLSDFTLDPFNHGTKVAGIIAGLRNNTSGIAGIAGGDASVNNPGVKLYSLNVAAYNMFWWLQAMHEGHLGKINTQSKDFAYGVHFSNHSYKMKPGWWAADSFAIAQREVKFANRLGVTFIASRGNDSTNNYVFPVNCDPDWAISVGASNMSGTKWSGSSYGSGMDVIAPGVPQTVVSTDIYRGYNSFSGTSSAAPHASGVVGLLMSYMNDPQNTYMNLAPEDCDFILQRSATDVGPTGYDSINGYGRLNAGKALRMVEKPVRTLYHFGTNFRYPYLRQTVAWTGWDTIRLTEVYTNFASPQVQYPVGKYIVKAYQVSASITQSGLYPSDSIIYYWPRHSASHVYALPTTQKKLDMHEKVGISSVTGAGALLYGFVYQVKDSTGANIGWWPCDTSFSSPNMKSLMEYSVLSKNKAVGINENRKENLNINLFPNPASQQQTLVIDSEQECSLKIELYDIMGRHLRNVYDGKAIIGKNTIMHHVAALPNSVYIYVIKMNNETVIRKFIKE